jgi:hypothetical protein
MAETNGLEDICKIFNNRQNKVNGLYIEKFEKSGQKGEEKYFA